MLQVDTVVMVTDAAIAAKNTVERRNKLQSFTLTAIIYVNPQYHNHALYNEARKYVANKK